jgi:hypothetical protein
MTERTDLSQLSDDGDVMKLDDGRMLRLRIEVDQDASINDYESDGKAEWTSNDTWNGHSTRPEGYTGRARIITRESRGSLWWEPYPDMTDEQVKAELPRIKDLMDYGFKGVILELCDGYDAYTRPIVVAVASLWGVDLNGNDNYIAFVVGELAHELEVG